MVVWTDTAIKHITEFIKNAKNNTQETAKSYMNKLIDYATDTLEAMPNIGKDIKYIVSNYKIRQLIYRKHRIVYRKECNNIIILAVLHIRLDLSKALKKLNQNKG